MIATVRRIALAAAGAAALVAASRARAEWSPPPQAVVRVEPPAYSPTYARPLPAPPAWMAVAPPARPAYRAWTRSELVREYRWLEAARIRFYRSGAWSPWQVRQFEAWYRVRRAELDRRWSALAWAAPRYGWRSDRRRGGEEGRWNGWRGDERERWEHGAD